MVLPNTSIINKPIMTRGILSLAIASSLLLAGCGDDNDHFVAAPSSSASAKFVKTFTANDVNSKIAPVNSATPKAKCGVTIEKVSYDTKGAADEDTNATAALMLPTGDAADCQGDRPVLLYAHGTTTDKGYDFAQVGNAKNPAVGEANLIAANFAAQGYIVVAPNYAGYDESKLDYHPYLVAQQQSTDMIDALESARAIIERKKRANDANYSRIDDSGKLFIAGYSQGGHVAMATARALQAKNEPVTAIAPSSGPYALAAFGDAIVSGNVNVGATAFVPLLARSLQNVDGKIYRNPTEIFTNQYADIKLPTTSTFEDLIIAGKLPQTALFQAAPTGIPQLDPVSPSDKFGFAAENYLIQTSFRAAYLADVQANPDSLIAGTGVLPAENPQNELRKALKANDLRGYIPNMPTLICGGNQDPTVFYDLNTGAMAAILENVSQQNPRTNLNVTVLDVDSTNEDDDDREDKSILTLVGKASMNDWDVSTITKGVQNQFAATVQLVGNNAAQKVIADGGTPAEAQEAAKIAVASTYHAGLVSTACTNATRQFFDQEFKQS